MRDEKKQLLAEKIASLIQNESGAAGNEQLWKAVGELGERLERLEQADGASVSIASQTTTNTHPSLDRYAVLEALRDPTSNAENEKTCSFEPNDKPCDHCSMCSSRGF
jgi:hypothetical protein